MPLSRSGRLHGLALSYALALLAAPASAQLVSGAAMKETLGIGDEPGRVSSEEVTITEGPFARQLVFFRSNEAPGTVVVHTSERFLYVVLPNNRALRYGIGVGREGFTWSGTEKISRIATWPSWTPPPEMHKRVPGLPLTVTGGMKNPQGARALYLGNTVYRIHGTNNDRTVGRAISSGCFRLKNEHVVHLASIAKVGTKVKVLQAYAGNAILDELDKDPRLGRKMIAGLSMRLHHLINDVESYSLHSGRQRIIGYLLRDNPVDGDKGATVTLPTNKGVIASRLNLTQEHFSRILHELSEKGLIVVEGRKIPIPDVHRLRTHDQ